MMKITPRIILSLALCIIVCSCAEPLEIDFCDSHDDFHDSHLHRVGQLDISSAGNGIIAIDFVVPTGTKETIEVLENPEQLFIINDHISCALDNHEAAFAGSSVRAHYLFNCGAENPLKHVDTLLLDYLPGLLELEARIETKAASKYFIISRQCPSPIFP